MNAKAYFKEASDNLNMKRSFGGMCPELLMRAYWISQLIDEKSEITEEQLQTIRCLFFHPHTKREEDADVALRVATFINTCSG